MEKEYEKQLSEKDKETVRRLSQKDQERKELEKLHENILAQVREEAKKQFEKAEIERKQDKLHTINKEIGSLENRKKNAEKRAWERLSICKWVLLMLVLGPIIAWLYYIHKSDWENVEKLTYFPPIIYMILVYLYIAIYGKNINPVNYFNELYDKYKYDEYNKFEYSDSEYNELVKMREDLKKEIEA